MKRIMFMAVIAIFSLLSGIASASTYVVKKGDILSRIGPKLSVNWTVMADKNNIQPPYRIYPGQKLFYTVAEMKAGVKTISRAEVAKASKITKTGVKKRVRKTVSVEMRNGEHQVKYLGRNKFRGKGSLSRAWEQFGLSEEEKLEVTQKMAAKDYGIGHVKIGDKFDLGLEGRNVLQDHPVMAWVDHTENQLEAAYVYTLSSGKEIWIVFKCGNPYLRNNPPPVSPPFNPPQTVQPPPQPWEPVTEVPPGDGGGEHFLYIPPEKSELAIEHEPIIGVWGWQNRLAEGKGGYAEYMAYLREQSSYGYANGLSPGLGVYGMLSDGNSKTSSYTWDENVYGVQAGLKYTTPKDQWGLKIRLVKERMDGRNDEGYSMHQKNVKLGAYAEYISWAHMQDGWFWGATLEGWLALDKKISSSWSGDKPSERNQIGASLFVQKKINDDWQWRVSAGPFYQSWDKLTGFQVQGELRWKEIFMFGPRIAVFPVASSVYDGIASARDLTTLTAFARLEVAGILRIADRERRMNEIKSADRAWLDNLIKENKI